MKDHVYLDHAASTPVDPVVLEKMLPFFTEKYGNPSSIHYFGQRSEAAVENARREVSDLLGAHPGEIIFTSCGSESDNIAIRGAAFSARKHRAAIHLLTTPVEHPAVLNTMRQLERDFGFELDLLPVDEYGLVSRKSLEAHLRPDTALVSIIMANNEIGTINPIGELALFCRREGITFHSDAVQAASQIAIQVDDLNVDLLSIGAHKFYGPKGVGALYVRDGTKLLPPLTGGSHEFGLRPGTHNVPLIVGLAEALGIAVHNMAANNVHYSALQNLLISKIPEIIPQCRLTGHPTRRLPNHASFVFRDIDGNQLLAALDVSGFACSSGSACKTGNPEPSGTLLALGFEPEWALGSLRVTVGRTTTQEQIEDFIEVLAQKVSQLRSTQLGI